MKVHGDPLLAASMRAAALDRQVATETETDTRRESHASAGDPLLEAMEKHDSHQQGEHRGAARLPLAPRNWAKELAGHGDPLLTVVVDSWASNNDMGTMETNENRDATMVARGGVRKYHGDNLLKATMDW